jgi:hypothetical protein
MADERDRDLPEFALDALAEAPELANALALVATAVDTSALPVGLRARLLASANGAKDRFAPFENRLAELFDLGAERVRELLSALSDAARWEPGPLAGSTLFHLEGGPRVATADAGFVRLPAGLEFPLHRHLGAERVLLLEGSYRDSDGKLWVPGDVHEMPAGSCHAFTVDADGSLLIATVLDAGIEIDGMGVVSAKKP